MLTKITPMRPSYFGATVIADLFFFFWREKRNNAIDNMAHVLPDADQKTVRRVARQSFRNYAKYLVDFIRAPKIRPEDVEGKIVFDNWPAIEAAHAEGKGIIFVLMHVGNWEMGGPFLTQHGYKVNVIAETFGHDKLNDMIVTARSTRGMRVIPMEHSAIAIVRALRRNEILGILIDRPMAENGVPVRFFGSPTMVPAGPARIALRTGARVLPVALVRMRGTADKLLALLEPNLFFEPTGDEQHDVRALTEAILAAHEGFIRRFPDQWYMFRRMWNPTVWSSASEAVLASES